jgi:hypothetical protein
MPCVVLCACVYLLQGPLADQLLQVWEFACCFGPLLGLEQVPSPQQLERGLLGVVSHTGTAASSILTAPPDGDHHPHRDAPDNIAAAAGGPAGDAGAAAAAAAAAAASAAAAGVDVSPEQVDFDAAAGAAWVQLHVAVLSVLVQVRVARVCIIEHKQHLCITTSMPDGVRT